MNISIEQLKNLIMKYDYDHGEYPESATCSGLWPMYEGLSVYEYGMALKEKPYYLHECHSK